MTDAEQAAIIELDKPAALVLAGPGCGKTHILAQRVYRAAMRGVDPRRMLCLTFTNRAAREMQQRIEKYTGSVLRPFVGNLHRFCLRFLFANRLVHPDTAVIDDEDYESFASSHPDNFRLPAHEILSRLDSIAYQKEHRHPMELIASRHYSGGGNEDDVVSDYRKFKEENHLISYDDILVRAYTALRDCKDRRALALCNFTWIQIDEVQDLTPLQLAIVDLVKAPEASVLYLGDEQQSIYGFAGATPRALNGVKSRCAGNIYHLCRNYRSPSQLVDLCNAFATQFLDIEPEWLPSSMRGPAEKECLTLAQADSNHLMRLNCALAEEFLQTDTTGSVAVLTRTNAEAEAFSDRLRNRGIPHLLVARKDLFKGVDFKTVWCHLALSIQPWRRNEWARILYQTKACRTLAAARRLVDDLSAIGLSPAQLLDIDAPSEVERLHWQLSHRSAPPIVVLDTETTGLDPECDDIIQISAVKIQNGKILESTRLSLFLASDRPVPARLGDVDNPMADIYESAQKLPPEQALSIFADYIRNCMPAGHNLTFDLAMLRGNYRRRTALPVPPEIQSEAPSLDTLAISRLVYPRLWNHTLGYLIGYLGIEGVNSHNADDDADATAKLLLKLGDQAAKLSPQIENWRESAPAQRMAERLVMTYGELWARSQQLLENAPDRYNLRDLFTLSYDYLLKKSCIKPIAHTDYVLTLIERISAPYADLGARAQLGACLQDLLTFNEGDLYVQDIIHERLVVMTIHKAKGMEMDNVIINNASGRFGDLEESYRVFYVAISRAKRRLAIGFSGDPARTLGYLTSMFRTITPRQMAMLLMKHGC